MTFNKLQNLNKREKYVVYAGSGLIALFILVQFIISPIISSRQRQVRALQAKTNILKDMHILKAQYDIIREKAVIYKKHYAARKKNFTLFAFLDGLTVKSGLKDNITYMKPSTSVREGSPYRTSKVEMKLQSITLKQLTAYLHGIETSKNAVSIKRISIIKTGIKEGYLNAVLQIETVDI